MAGYLDKGVVIDAHHHLWDLEAVHYPWLMACGVRRFFGDPAPIQKNYLSDDFQADRGAVDVVGSVHIQVGADDTLAEASWVQHQIETHQYPSVHIADVQLEAGNLAHKLEQLVALGGVRGVRQIIGRHSVEDAQTGSGNLVQDPMWRKGLAILGDFDLSFDLQLTSAQYANTLDALEHTPDTKIVICHFGSPWDQSAAAFDEWHQAMRRFADLPQVSIKLSGFSMFKPEWNQTDIEPYILAALDLFGADRCMVGSNYPVDGLHRPYRDIFEAVEHALANRSKTDQQKVFHNTAKTFYRI